MDKLTLMTLAAHTPRAAVMFTHPDNNGAKLVECARCAWQYVEPEGALPIDKEMILTNTSPVQGKPLRPTCFTCQVELD